MYCQRPLCGRKAEGIHISRNGDQFNFCADHFEHFRVPYVARTSLVGEIQEELRKFDDRMKSLIEDRKMDEECD